MINLFERYLEVNALPMMKSAPLQFKKTQHPSVIEAQLKNWSEGDGVRFSLEFFLTCYRRGQNKLLIEVAHENHHYWGCFDSDDQPVRYYHKLISAVLEANMIAKVLLKDHEDLLKARATKMSAL